MASLKDKIEAEYENIDKLVAEIPPADGLPFLEFLLHTPLIYMQIS